MERRIAPFFQPEMHAEDFSTKPSAKDEVLSRDVAKPGYVHRVRRTFKFAFRRRLSAAAKARRLEYQNETGL
jgi:hypothetical protein